MEQDHQIETENIFPNLLPLFALIGVTFIVFIVVGAILMLLVGKAVLLAEVFIIIPALVFVIVARAPINRVFRIIVPAPNILIASIFVAIGAFILADQMDRLILSIFPKTDFMLNAMEAMVEMLSIRSLWDGVLIIFSAVLVAGLSEEMLFRGIFQGTLEAKLNATIAVWISACLFAFIHVMPWTILQILLFGLVLGYMAYKSGSILPGVIVHACNNLFSIILMNLGEDKTSWYASQVVVNPIFLIIAVAFFVLGLKPFVNISNCKPPTLENP